MKRFPFVILGGGVAGGNAASEFARQQTGKGSVALLTADRSIPYDRPPLSKNFLAQETGEKDILINDPSFYKDHGIEMRTRHQVIALDFKRRVLKCQPGRDIGFEKLLIATGSNLRRLKVPGGDLNGIFYLRLLDHSKAIRDRIQKGKQAVVIGSGFIGIEVASVLARKGMRTTLVYPQSRLWEKFFTPEMSAFYEKYYRQKGVELLPRERVTGFGGSRSVKNVRLQSGRELAADLVVAGIGVAPAVELFSGTGLGVKDGILVDEYLHTNMAGVWAVGDLANYPDKIFGQRRRIEHWDNAVEQAKVAVRNMMGKPQPFIHVPYYFSDEFDLSYEFWGDNSRHDEVIYRGQVARGKFSAWWLKSGRLQAAFVMDRPGEERELAPKWIMEQRRLDPNQLGSARQSLPAIDAAFYPGNA